MLKVVGFILSMLLSFNVAAQDIPDFSANYQVKLNGIQAGELQRNLTSFENGLRQFSSISQAKGIFAFFKPDIVEESSQWRLEQDSVQPQHYLYQRTGGKKDKTLTMQFDWQQMVADIDDRKHPWKLKIEPGTVDKLIYQISLMRDLKSGKKDFIYRIADGGKLKTYHIEVLGEETVKTPMGKFNAIKLTRKLENPEDRETFLWCAPSLSYLPVKLKHIEHGTVFTALLKQLKGIETSAAIIQPSDNTVSSHSP